MLTIDDLPERQVLAERARAQLLTGDRPTDPVGVVRGVGALQAQDPRAHPLAYRVRTEGVDLHAVITALARPGTLVTTWLMRGTLHAVTAEDARWLVPLLRPPRSAGRTRRLALGLDDALLDRALPVVLDLLAAGPLTRTDVAGGLAERGIALWPGQAVAHLLGVGAREGLLCRGPERDGEPTYVPFDAWAGRPVPLDRAEALARLAALYLDGHGPATAADLAAWSGLPLRDARAGLAALDDVEPVRIDGAPAYRRPGPAAASTAVRLLPAYDEHLLGHRSHAFRLTRGGGVVPPTVLAGGRVVGTWSRRGRTVVVQPFAPPATPLRAELAAEVADLGRFLGADLALVVA